ncbi:MAG: MFS transporter [Myxococcaceae bacterium]|nr:MFS transporter [Myxococcaceae bacterium]
MQPHGRETKAPALGLYYLLVYASIGVSLPFFPQYLKSLGLTGTEVGLLLAVSPALSLVAPPFWGQLADRSGRPGLVLFAVTAASCSVFALFLVVQSFTAVFAVFVLYGCFASAISTVIDSMTLRHVLREGGSYSRVRLFGSLGFAVMSMTFGRLVDVIDRRVVFAIIALTAAGAIWAGLGLARVRVSKGTGPRPTFAAALGLAESRDVRLFLIAVALHWFACGPYHSALSIHVTALKLETHVIGDAATLGVVTEIAVMTTWPRWGHKVSPRQLLFVSFAASAVRWAGMALTNDGAVLVAMSVFHGLTFGTFFLSAVAYMAERSPETLRATGQALFVAAAFGVGGLTGYLATGVGLDLLPSSHAVFGVAAVLELVPALLILRLRENAEKRVTS